MRSWQDVFGPIDWPDNVPTAEMTSTYIPTEQDKRFDNANLTEKDSMGDQSLRMGFYHYYNSVFWRSTADHFELTGETHLLTELKAQTFVKQADHMFCTALDPKFIGIKPAGDPDGSAKLLGQGPIRMVEYWREVGKYMVTALPQPQRGYETELTIVGGNLLCYGATKSPVKNIASLVRETHTFDPDRFILMMVLCLKNFTHSAESLSRWKKCEVSTLLPDGIIVIL